jgi:hypothetical protein
MAAAGVGQGFGARISTAWQQTQAAWANRHAMAQRFLDEGALVHASLSNAHANSIDGTVKLAAIAALDHLNPASTNVLTFASLVAAAQAVTAAPPTAAQTAASILDLRV